MIVSNGFYMFMTNEVVAWLGWNDVKENFSVS